MNSRNRTGAAALAGAAITGLIAFALFLAGGLLLWANAHFKDADGYLSTGKQHFASPAYAITADDLNVRGGHVDRDRYGTIRVSATGTEKPVFVGVARTSDVDRYLSGVATSEVDDIDVAPFRATYVPHAGTKTPAAPTTRNIWAAQAHGAGKQSLTWNVEDGNWSVVVMNADGSRSVTAGVSAGAKVSYIAAFGWGALGLGVAFIVTTALLTLYGTRPAPPRRTALAPAQIKAT
jgi:hypothetical protein